MIEIDFTSKFEEFNDYEKKYLDITRVTLKHLGLDFSPVISISFVDNKYIHKINKKYRDVDKETDVISFAFLDDDENRDNTLHSKGVVPLGDIYISVDKAKEQAESYGHSLERELSFLYVHGLLHLLGYDHQNELEEKEMFGVQEEILNKLGVSR